MDTVQAKTSDAKPLSSYRVLRVYGDERGVRVVLAHPEGRKSIDVPLSRVKSAERARLLSSWAAAHAQGNEPKGTNR